MHARPQAAPATLIGALNSAVDRFAESPAVVFDERRITYAQLRSRVERVTRGLVTLGVGAGDRVGFLSPNRPEYLELLFGAARLGAMLVPINSRYGITDLKEALARSGVKILLFAGKFRHQDYRALLEHVLAGREPDRARAVAALPQLERLVSLDDDPGLGLLTYGDLAALGAREAGPLPPEVAGDSPGLMLFTSGSSGFPKPVVLTQGQLVRNMERVRRRQGIRADDRVLSFLPYFHVFGGVISTLVPILAGGTIVMLEAFDATRSLELVERHRCTVVYSVAPCYRAWLEHPDRDRYDLSSIRTGVCSAGLATMTATAKRVRDVLCPMHSLFGMTETTGVATLTGIDDDEELATTTAGFPLPDAEVGIFDPDSGDRLPAGAEGEIRVRGDMVTHGYFRLPEDTRRSLDEAGWLHTGDRGRMTARGYLQVVGRLDDRLRCGGENVDPRELELFLESHPYVARCQVVGVPDARLGEVPVAFVVARDRIDDQAEAEILAFCRGRIADFKIPRRLFFVEDFPGWMHKVQRFKLRQEAIHRMGLADAG